MSYRRDHRGLKVSPFDDIEEGGFKDSHHKLDEQSNNKEIGKLHDKIMILKGLTGDIHREVESQNQMLSRMGESMDVSRGYLSGVMGRFRMVVEKKSGRKACRLATYIVAVILTLYYLIWWLYL